MKEISIFGYNFMPDWSRVASHRDLTSALKKSYYCADRSGACDRGKGLPVWPFHASMLGTIEEAGHHSP